MNINDIIKALRREAALPRSVGQSMAICSGLSMQPMDFFLYLGGRPVGRRAPG